MTYLAGMREKWCWNVCIKGNSPCELEVVADESGRFWSYFNGGMKNDQIYMYRRAKMRDPAISQVSSWKYLSLIHEIGSFQQYVKFDFNDLWIFSLFHSPDRSFAGILLFSIKAYLSIILVQKFRWNVSIESYRLLQLCGLVSPVHAIDVVIMASKKWKNMTEHSKRTTCIANTLRTLLSI